ncbi:MAG: hypothetical protein E3K37_11600 [Candidatus Kuenenia sp.]|nr:hypothetical protein [Candidatus Kuenenia hertensis]
MKKMLLTAALCLFACSTAKVLNAGDIYGYVYDANKKALPAVEISTQDNTASYSGQSSGSGHYSLSLKVGTYTLCYEKKGYQTQTNDISLKMNETKYIELVVMDVSQNPEETLIPKKLD